jgi:hypothetical protein
MMHPNRLRNWGLGTVVALAVQARPLAFLTFALLALATGLSGDHQRGSRRS